jgi:site-specific recombinase XerC
MSPLARILQGFFTDKLLRQRQASPHTITAYRDTCRLLLTFAWHATGLQPTPPQRVRHGCVDNPKRSSRQPAAAPTGAARVPCAGRRFGDLGAESSVASLSPGATARS